MVKPVDEVVVQRSFAQAIAEINHEWWPKNVGEPYPRKSWEGVEIYILFSLISVNMGGDAMAF